ncbi:PREDICTED: aldose 1-epimerase-like [Ipomoea nil]|uniref:aldose 1-epimerase-like n=1 Tax=Ipomoea nil TaxID=35883 RepID=UPI000900B27F|nr:PREDICTED: aldose 1-epimerase-like [Ipomoea nil]
MDKMSKVSALALTLMVCFVGFGVPGSIVNGQEEEKVGFYEIKKGDFSLKFTNFGAKIVSVILPDKNGNLTDVVLGYDTIDEYLNDTSNFGAIVGRVANRIAGAKFTLNGTLYKLIPNSGNNTIHGGPKGFGKLAWKVEEHVPNGPQPRITFTYHSPDGDQGFPGDVIASVTYAIKEPHQLIIDMKAKALNKATPVNLAQHTYWNLGGHGSGDILSEKLQLFASHITTVDEKLIPTGEIAPINNTAYDFLKPRDIGTQLNKLPEPAPGRVRGFDNNYVIDGDGEGMKEVAIVYDEKTGIRMELKANSPGVQLFTANSLKDKKGKGGAVYQSHAAVCLETQGFPDAVNHPNFPSTIVTPTRPYHHSMFVTFTTNKRF